MAVTDIGKETASEMGLSLPYELTAESRSDDLLDLRLRWEELLGRDIQGLCKAKQFEVSDAPDLGFNLRNHIFGDIPTEHTTAGSQHGLRESLLLTKGAYAVANDIFLLRHLPELEVDRSGLFGSIASVFGRFGIYLRLSEYNLLIQSSPCLWKSRKILMPGVRSPPGSPNLRARFEINLWVE